MMPYPDIVIFGLASIIVAAFIIWRPDRRSQKRRPSPLGAIPFDPSYDRIHSLDGLRAVSVSLVVASHLGMQHLVPGGLGVTCFFFISGFLITRLLLTEVSRTGTIDIAAFYRRRFWRLWPAIAVAIAGLIAISAAFGEAWSPVGHIVSSLLFMQNYWSVTAPASNPLNIHWSLAVEWHFYLAWPFALLALQVKQRLAVPVIVVAIIAVLALRVWSVFALQISGVPFEDINEWTYELTHLRADSLLFGALLACMAHDAHWRLTIGRARSWWIWAGLAILLASILFRDEIYRATLRYSFQGCGLFLIFAGILYTERARFFRWALNLRPVVWLGAISFSIYLWHMTLLRAVREFTGVENSLTVAASTIAMTLLVSWLSYRWIECPFQRLGRRQTAKAVGLSRA